MFSDRTRIESWVTELSCTWDHGDSTFCCSRCALVFRASQQFSSITTDVSAKTFGSLNYNVMCQLVVWLHRSKSVSRLHLLFFVVLVRCRSRAFALIVNPFCIQFKTTRRACTLCSFVCDVLGRLP